MTAQDDSTRRDFLQQIREHTTPTGLFLALIAAVSALAMIAGVIFGYFLLL